MVLVVGGAVVVDGSIVVDGDVVVGRAVVVGRWVLEGRPMVVVEAPTSLVVVPDPSLEKAQPPAPE